MPKQKKNSKKTSAKKGQLDHKEALLNVANFLGRYRKWYDKYQAQTSDDDGGSNPGGEPPKPPMP